MELLVCIAVVCVLMVLLLPASSAIRKASETSRCVGNLRALGVAIRAYAGDNDGYLPSGFNPSESTLVRALEPYAGPMKEAQMAADIFYCPTNVRLGSPPKNGYPTGVNQRYKGFAGYFLNYVINGSIHPIKGLPQEGEPTPKYRIRLSEIRIPARTVSLLDLITRAPSVTAPPSSGFAKATYFNPASTSFGLGLVHNGRGNILFVDGHVESFDGSAPLPVQSLPDTDTTWFP